MKALRLMPLVKSAVKNSKARTIVFLIFILFCVTCVLLTTSIIIPMSINMEYKVNRHPYNLELNAEIFKGDTSDSDVEKIKAIPHVTDVYQVPRSINVFETEGKLSSSFFLTYFHNGYTPVITSGRNVKSGEKNAAVLPEIVRMNDPETQRSIEFDCKTLVGTTLKMQDEYRNEYNLNIVGTYDITDPALSSDELIVDFEQLEEYRAKLPDDSETVLHSIIIDNYTNRDSVENACKDIAKFCYSNSFNIDLSSFNMSLIVLLIVLAVFLIMVIIGTAVFVSNCVSNRTRELALYRSLGYKFRHIFTVIFTEYFLMLLLATIVAVLISLAAAVLFINPYLDEFIGGGLMAMRVQLDSVSVAAVFAVFLLIIIIICLIAARRTGKIPLAVLLKER